MRIFCDNQVAISIAKILVHHDRTKHVEIDYHFTKEKIDEGVITLRYMLIDLQIADILTKAPSRVNFERNEVQVEHVEHLQLSLRESVDFSYEYP